MYMYIYTMYNVCPPQGKTEVVAMPSEQYSLELTNTTVASLDHSTSIVTGLVIGDTEIVLQDKSECQPLSLYRYP